MAALTNSDDTTDLPGFVGPVLFWEMAFRDLLIRFAFFGFPHPPKPSGSSLWIVVLVVLKFPVPQPRQFERGLLPCTACTGSCTLLEQRAYLPQVKAIDYQMVSSVDYASTRDLRAKPSRCAHENIKRFLSLAPVRSVHGL